MIVLKQMKKGIAPGPDGVPIDFNMKLRAKLIPRLLEVYQEARRTEAIPPDLNVAQVILIPKPSSNLQDLRILRPLSLTNTDIKLLSKCLANRILPHTLAIVRQEQYGFVPSRSTNGAIRRAMAVIQMSSEYDTMAIISLDARKAFDSMEWPYLFTVLDKFVLGQNYIVWLKSLYTIASVVVKINGFMCTKFCLKRGTMQGCPMSLILYTLAF